MTKGLIDDIRVYNRALSSTDIAELYQYKPARVVRGRIANARLGN